MRESTKGKMLKRIFDILFSLSALLAFLPLLAVLGLIVKFTSPGPVIFKHKRIGKSGKEFYVYKFRTMVANAEKLGAGLTEKNDKRITPVGAVLRRFSLDEFPQFLNVLRGEMSIVGPRPEIPEIVKDYSPFQKRVLGVRPGLSGFPQINGRAELTIPKKLRLDVYYVKHTGFCFDLYIIFKTIFVILSGKGAY